MQVCRRLVGVEFDHYVLQFAVMLGCRQDVVAISLDDQLKHRRRFIDWEDKVIWERIKDKLEKGNLKGKWLMETIISKGTNIRRPAEKGKRSDKMCSKLSYC